MHVCHMWHMHCISVITISTCTMHHRPKWANILLWQQNSKVVKASNTYIHVFKIFIFFTKIKSTFSAPCSPQAAVLPPWDEERYESSEGKGVNLLVKYLQLPLR